MPSAYILIIVCLRQTGKSFKYIKKRRGPKIEPCGTPHVADFVLESCCSHDTFVFDHTNKIEVNSKLIPQYHKSRVSLLEFHDSLYQTLYADLETQQDWKALDPY